MENLHAAKKQVKSGLAAGALAMALSMSANAAQITDAGKKKVTSLVQKIAQKEGKHVKVEAWFEGPSVFAGAIVSDGTERFVLWSTADGNYLIVGNLFEYSTSRNLTDVAATDLKAKNPIALALEQTVQATLQRIMPQVAQLDYLKKISSGQVEVNVDEDPVKLTAKPEEAAKIAQSASKAGGFLIKKGNKGVVYSFIDPDCPHCRSAHSWMKSLDADIVYLPVQASGDDDEFKPLFLSMDSGVLDRLISGKSAGKYKVVQDLEQAKQTLSGNEAALKKILNGYLATPVIVVVPSQGKPAVFLGGDRQSVINALNKKSSVVGGADLKTGK